MILLGWLRCLETSRTWATGEEYLGIGNWEGVLYSFWGRRSGPITHSDDTDVAVVGICVLVDLVSDDLGWPPRIVRDSPDSYTAVYVPLWLPLLLVAVPTALLWWRDRRIPPGCCRECAYDLTGNISGVCPECGREIGETDGQNTTNGDSDVR